MTQDLHTSGISIELALNWAFRQERAHIHFDELGETAHGNRRGVDGIAIMIERGSLGFKIDGGGCDLLRHLRPIVDWSPAACHALPAKVVAG